MCVCSPKVEYLEHQGDWASLERKFDVTLDTARPGKSLGLSPEEAARCVGSHQPCVWWNKAVRTHLRRLFTLQSCMHEP